MDDLGAPIPVDREELGLVAENQPDTPNSFQRRQARKVGGPSDEMMTPPWLFEQMAIQFDLDVCAPTGGVEWVPAQQHYDLEADGLTLPWVGRVWMNPPYGNSSPWVTKFMKHRNGIALLPHSRSWWHTELWADADGMCDPNFTNPHKRLFQFIHPETLKLTNVYMPVVLAAYGAESVAAIARVGIVRTVLVFQRREGIEHVI